MDRRKKIIKEREAYLENLNKAAEKHLIEKLGFDKEWVRKSMNKLRKNQKMK